MTLRCVAERLTPALAGHGEGPVTIGDALLWLDMLRGDVLVTDPVSGATERVVLDSSVVAMVRPCADGTVLVATETDLWRYRRRWAEPAEHVAALPVPPSARLNEGGCDPLGRAWIGSMAYDQAEGAGQLFCVDPAGGVRVVIDDLTVSNGIAFRADDMTGYFVDSATRRIDRLRLDAAGALVERQPWVATDGFDGVPDGLALDADGGVWVAFYGGGTVVRFDPEGRADVEVHVPVPNTTACAFVGTSRRLAITTSRGEPGAARASHAGALYIASVPVHGAPVLPFGATERS